MYLSLATFVACTNNLLFQLELLFFASFLLELKTQFDISAKDALKIITTNMKLLPADKEEDQNLHLLLLLSPLLSYLLLAADSTVCHSITSKIHRSPLLKLFRWIFIPFR